MSITSLGYLCVETPNANAWATFGPEVLGLAADGTGADGALYFRVDERRRRIAIRPGAEDRLVYVGWELAGEPELNEFAERLSSAGVDVRIGKEDECAERKVEAFLAATDPAGIVHEFFYGQLMTFDPFVPGRPLSRFVTGDQGLGHVVFIVPDIKSAHDFYTGAFGFRLTDLVDTPFGIRAQFYRCNPRHHSLAILEIPGMAGLHHLMLEVGELDDVGTAYDIVQQRSIPLAMTLGRHSTDRMVSFYMVSPSGFQVELGWGGRQIEDATWRVVSADSGDVWGHAMVPDSGLPSTVRPC